jgi:Maltose operon periplasmic protein precursor (MalM)
MYFKFSKNSFRFVIACCLGTMQFGMAGCALAPRAQADMIAKVSAAPSCCESMDKFAFSDLSLGKTEIEIDEKTPAFNFESGKSLFRAYLLPKGGGTLNISLRSYTNASVGGLFQPDLLLLDAKFRVSRAIAKPLFGLPLISEQAFSPAYSVYEFSVGPDREQFKYLVIRTTDELLAISTPVQGTATLPVGGAFVRFPTTGRIVGRPMGYLTLNVSSSPASP